MSSIARLQEVAKRDPDLAELVADVVLSIVRAPQLELGLTPAQAAILRCMERSGSAVVSYEAIAAAIGRTTGKDVTESTVKVHMGFLRQRRPELQIRNVSGEGYVLVEVADEPIR